MDVSEPTVGVDVPPARPAPCGIIRLWFRFESKRNGHGRPQFETCEVRGSRGQKRQGEDVEELAANPEEQHLDADVEERAHKT